MKDRSRNDSTSAMNAEDKHRFHSVSLTISSVSWFRVRRYWCDELARNVHFEKDLSGIPSRIRGYDLQCHPDSFLDNKTAVCRFMYIDFMQPKVSQTSHVIQSPTHSQHLNNTQGFLFPYSLKSTMPSNFNPSPSRSCPP